uniref:Uncharacterized protein n=1 Tax=Candidatus Kentrum sp. SD TaxID=2126332 RepID=A0A450Z5B1_9GAMM|nr:MAG: hypothetical protein BECKSD772E_GA0070983_115310 [Candidatus Kentron sp. SD]
MLSFGLIKVRGLVKKISSVLRMYSNESSGKRQEWSAARDAFPPGGSVCGLLWTLTGDLKLDT